MKPSGQTQKLGLFARGGIACAAGWLMLSLSLFGAQAVPAAGDQKQAVQSRVGALRVPFVENMGQVPDPAVRFYARTFGGTVYVLQSGDVVYALPKYEAIQGAEGGDQRSEIRGQRAEGGDQRSEIRDQQSAIRNSSGLAILRESFAGGRRPAPTGERPAGTAVNYFMGQDPARWQSNLPSFDQVSLGEVYAGIRLGLRARGNSVEKIFTVAPGADPLQIRVVLEGAESLAVNDRDELEVATVLGVVRFSAPVAWQTDASGRDIPVSIAYAADDDAFGFALGAYDPERPLMIDPLLSSTFVGGSGGDYAQAIAIEGSTSNIVVAGYTDSLNFPLNAAYQSARSGGQDIFISKFDSYMTNLIVSTYLGGSSDDVANSLAIDAGGNVFVAGYTESANFPTAFPYQPTFAGVRDAFVLKFNSDLSFLAASTFLGGSAIDAANAVAVSTGGIVFVAGYTESGNFPMSAAATGRYTNYNGSGDGFIVAFDNGLAELSAATYLGGAGADGINALVLGGQTNVFVAGYTYSSTNFPVSTNGAYTNFAGVSDAFISRLNATLTNLDASTLLGGTNQDSATAIGLDLFTNVFVAGYTYSSNFPVTTNGAYTNLAGSCDAFVAKLSFALTNRTAATFLGGAGEDKVYGLAISSNIVAGTTNIVLVGYTASSNFPVSDNAYDTSYNGGGDAFVAVLTHPLTNRYAVTFLGGIGEDQGKAVVIVSKSNSVIVAGYTASGDFPVSDASYSTRYNLGAYDGFLSRLAAALTYGTKKWETATVGGDIYSTPAMGPNGLLYVTIGSAAGKIRAINTENGQTVYENATNGAFYASPAIGTNEMIYCGDANNIVQACNLGLTSQWTRAMDEDPYVSCAAIDLQRNLYVGTYDGSFNFYKISEAGAIAWKTNINAWGSILASPAIGSNGTIYSCASAGLFSFNADGSTNWSFSDANAQFKSSPVIGSNGTIYVGSNSNKLYAIDPADGHLLWSVVCNGEIIGSAAIGTNGVIYAGTTASTLYAITSSGTVQRTWTLAGNTRSTPALGANGTLYVGCGVAVATDTKFYSINTISGATNWTINIGDTERASPLIGMDGTVYIGTEGATKFYAIYGNDPPALSSPWHKFHHDMMNAGRAGFDTSPRPPSNVSATRGTGSYTNSILVTWNAVQYATVYEIYRSTATNSSGASKIASTAITNYLDNIEVADGQVYYYWIKAKSPLGLSAFSESYAGGTRPLPPTGLVASKGGGGYTNSILVSWNNSLGAVTYHVYRSTQNDTNTAQPLGAPVSVTNITDADITRSVTYWYWVKGSNIAGASDLSAGDYGGTPPLPPASISAGQGSATAYVPVTWAASVGASSYLVYSNITADFSSAGVVTSTTGASFDHYGLIPCRQYYYWVRASNYYGFSDISGSGWGSRILTAPTSINASENESAQIRVSWGVGNTNLAETTAHQVWRSQTNDLQTAAMRIETAYTAVTMTNYDDLEITRGPVYYYWVRAKNPYGTSEFSQVDSGATVPIAPTGISASDGTYNDKIVVTWIAAPYAITYNIYRAADYNSSNATVIGNVSGSVTTYDDTQVDPGVIYYYWVRSVGAYGESVFSGTDLGWWNIAAPLTLTASDGTSTSYVAVAWSASLKVSAYEVWRGANTNSADALKLANSVTATEYQDSAAVPGRVYYYWVKAKTAAFTSGFSPNDSGYRAIGKVDIGASDFVFLPTVVAAGGHPDAVSFRIANYGDQALTAPDSAWVMSDFYLSANSVYGDGDDVWFGAFSNSVPLSVQTSAGIILTGTTRQLLTIPALALGRYYVFVHIRHCLPSAWDDPVPDNNTAVRLGQTIAISNQEATTTVLNDYNGDGRADMAVYHESDGYWYIRTVENERIVYGDSWGEPGYQPVIGDYDDNGLADLAVYHEASGYWFIRSVAGQVIAWYQWWGSPGYKAVPGDYDGDRKSDLAVYHEAGGYWFVESVSGVRIAWAEWWGAPAYKAIPGDYDGDGKSDFAVYHESDGYWYIRAVAGGQIAWAAWWGGTDYQAVPGDYNGDGASDLAVYDKLGGYWFIQTVAGARIAWGEYWGAPDHTPVPGDFDGDGIYDLAVYNEASGLWYIRTLAGVTMLYGESWGAPGYRPVSSLP